MMLALTVMGLLLLLTHLPLSGQAETLGEKIRASVNPKLFRQSHIDSERRKKEILAKSDLRWERDKHCRILPSVPCFVGMYGFEFVTPFPIAIEPNLSSFNVGVLEFTWVPFDSAAAGAATIAKLELFSETHKPLSCKDTECQVVVGTSGTRDLERVLAICKAVFLNEMLGPPSKCDPIAFRVGKEWWIRVVDSEDFVQSAPMVVFTLDVKGLDRHSILASLDRTLAGPPLLLEQRAVKNDWITATGTKRFSRILSGHWFEWAQVLIELDEEFRVVTSLDLLVNKQNTDNPSDWHLPSDQQQEEYGKAIKQSVTEGLGKTCVDPVWQGSQSLRCRQLRTMDGATVSIPAGLSLGQGYKGPLSPRIKVTPGRRKSESGPEPEQNKPE